MSLLPGTRLGPYEVTALIGAGGMGEVYRARDTKLARDVAVKVLPTELADDPAALARFEREAQAVAALSHPNILSIHDFGRQGDTAYAVMELLEGETLRARLEHGALPARKAVDLAVQMAEGLAAAHEKGIVHRDLKPENVFVTGEGRVKLLDFGLAKRASLGSGADSRLETAEQHTGPGTVMGTVRYMSPEQVRGDAVDHRSDIFSFGVVLYEMLAGRQAFGRETAAESLTAILKEEPPEIAASGSGPSPALERIVQHCLEKKPGERFQSARDLAFDLEMLSGGSAVSGAASIAGRPATRRWLVPALITAALVALCAGAYVAGGRAARVEPPTFSRLTFRHGTIRAARFTPDGKTVIYGAAWEGKPVELFAARAGTAESRALGLGNAEILSVAKSGEMAILLRARVGQYPFESVGTLARVPAEGGAPRELRDNVSFADWAPNGNDMAIVLSSPPGTLEYPPGKRLYNPGTGWVSHARFSPDGTRIAFLEHWFGGDDGWVSVVDLAGKAAKLTSRFFTVEGLAWTPNGKEVLFAASATGAGRSIYAVDLSGRLRVVVRTAGSFWLHDVSPDGRLVVSQSAERMGLKAVAPGTNDEVDLSWFDWAMVLGMSRDGKTVLFSESGEASGGRYGVFARTVDGSPAVRLADGTEAQLSDDNKWVVVSSDNPAHLQIWPTGAGESRTLNLGTIVPVSARFFPDNRRLVVAGAERGHEVRLYLFDEQNRAMKPLTPEGLGGGLLSPDGKYVLARDVTSGKRWVYPTEGGDRHAALGIEEGEVVQAWTTALPPLLVTSGRVPLKILRVDPFTGDRQLWKELVPSDPAGVVYLGPLAGSRDGRGYVYSYYRMLSDLYLIEGLK